MIRRLAALSPADRILLVRATVRVIAVRTWLTVRPIAAVMGRVRRWAERPLTPRGMDPDRVVWAVSAAGRRLLRRNPCLTEALAAWSLLRQYGVESHLRIGVAREGHGHLEAHAWVEQAGVILIGGDESPDSYVPLPLFDVS